MLFRKRLSVGYAAGIFFLIAFIGNQADNIWGSFAFALPPVYEGIYGMPMEAVQVAFLAAPFIYPAIRLLQAFIIMLIAVPLIRVLSQTNWLWSKDNILCYKTSHRHLLSRQYHKPQNFFLLYFSNFIATISKQCF